jgi:hypothetical protein
MPDYDRQLLVKFLTGDPSDNAVKNAAWRAKRKVKTTGLKLHTAEIPRGRSGVFGRLKDKSAEKHLRAELAKLTPASRLYLEGHGYWKTQKLGEWGAEEVADLLVECGLKQVAVISIMACEAAKAQKHTGHEVVGTAVENTLNSFAYQFHFLLAFKHQLFVPVHARLRVVTTTPAGTKVVRKNGQWCVHQPRSKVRFDWGPTGGQQISYVDYAELEEVYT